MTPTPPFCRRCLSYYVQYYSHAITIFSSRGQKNKNRLTSLAVQAMNQIEKVEPQEITAIPFMVFLMGCETALRVQEKGKLQ